MLRVLVRLRGLVDVGVISPEDPLFARVAERLRRKDPFIAYQPKTSLEDLKRVEGTVAGELKKEFPDLEKHLLA